MRGLVAAASIGIDAPIDRVWSALVDPASIEQYMFGTHVDSTWKQGSAIVWKGKLNGKDYEDSGVITEIEPLRRLQYTHFSPLTGLPDVPENYNTVTYALTTKDGSTIVELVQDNNATEEARGHSEANWCKMLEGLKALVENQ